MHKTLAVLLLWLFTALGSVQSFAASTEDAQDNVVWVDVRSPQEYRQGHVEGAINIPHGEIAHKISALIPDPYTEIHLYGATGTFAGLALEILMEMGYQAVANEGSYSALVARAQAQ